MKRIQSLLLISLLWFFEHPYAIADVNKGSNVIVLRNNGSGVAGELIAVKSYSIILMEKNTLKDVSISINDIHSITVKKKSKPLPYISIGALSGFLIGGLLTYTHPGSAESQGTYFWYGALVGAPIGIIGGLLAIGATTGANTYLIKGVPPDAQKNILEKLKKLARIKDAT